MAIDRRLLTYINWGLVAATLLLFWVGIGNLYSASGVRVEDGISLAPYYERQMIWGAFGLIAMVACMSFDYRHLQAMALPFFSDRALFPLPDPSLWESHLRRAPLDRSGILPLPAQ